MCTGVFWSSRIVLSCTNAMGAASVHFVLPMTYALGSPLSLKQRKWSRQSTPWFVDCQRRRRCRSSLAGWIAQRGIKRPVGLRTCQCRIGPRHTPPTPVARSTGFDIALLDDLSEFRDLGSDETRERIGRHQHGFSAFAGETGSHFIGRQDRVDLRVELGDSARLHFGRREHAPPLARLVTRNASLGHGRQIRNERRALCARHGDGAQAIVLHLRPH